MNRVEYSDLVGTPYETMNCYQLVREVYRRGGVDLPEDPTPKGWSEITDAPQWGDVVVFSRNNTGIMNGVGVYVDDRKILTAFERKVAAVVHERTVLDHIAKVYRYNG